MYSCIELYLVHFHGLMSLFHVKIWPMHTLIRTVTPMCFGPQRAIFREYNWYIFTARSTKYVPDVKFSLLSSVCYVSAAAWAACLMLHSIIHAVLNKLNLTSGAHFVGLAMKMHQSHFLKMARWGPKHVGVTVLMNGMLRI
jgi:hypothetical protein